MFDAIQSEKIDKLTKVTNRFAADKTAEPAFVLRAKDRLALPILVAYLTACLEHQVHPAQVAGVTAMLHAFATWQADHPGELQLPDAAGYPPS